MTYDNLIVDIGPDFVGEITLNRPEQLNTFNTPLAGELAQALLRTGRADNCESHHPQRSGQGVLRRHRR